MTDLEKRQRRPAIGYTRTSSASNVGDEKGSVPRQRKAVQAYANKAGYTSSHGSMIPPSPVTT